MEFDFVVRTIFSSDFHDTDIAMLASVGNFEFNLIYLATFSSNDWDLLPTGESTHETRRAFLYQKYVTKRWCAADCIAATTSPSPSLATDSVNLIEFDDPLHCGVRYAADCANTVLDSNRCEDLLDGRPNNAASLDLFSCFDEHIPASDPWASSTFDFSILETAVDHRGAVDPVDNQDCIGSWDIIESKAISDPWASSTFDVSFLDTAVDNRGAVDPVDNQDCIGSWDIDSKAKCSNKQVLLESLSSQSRSELADFSSIAFPNRKSECVICLENTPTHLSIPCGHKAYCELCSLNFVVIKDCPICRTPITGMVKVFDV